MQLAQTAATLALEACDELGQVKCLRYAARSLGLLRRHEESVEVAYEAAGLAQRIDDKVEQSQSLRLAAWSLSQLGRYNELLEAALKAHKLAQHCVDDDESALSMIMALRAAEHVPSQSAVEAYVSWLRADAAKPDALRGIRPHWYADEWLVAVMRADAWKALDAVIANPAVYFPEARGADGHGLGKAAAAMALLDGGPTGLNALRLMLPRIKRLMGQGHTHDARIEQILPTIIGDFAEACRNPALLRDVAGLLTPELATNAPDQAALLRTLAEFDESKTPDAWLARADPDFAIWLRSVRNLSALGTSEKATQKVARKRKTK